ncbi:hypothetical protein [Streptomyces sp. NPDC058623]|uniref:hypothetical protein n=1 Tax=Streptomyces sp. NPDC058623 TaxID=3346563 RepID=UPI00365BBA98
MIKTSRFLTVALTAAATLSLACPSAFAEQERVTLHCGGPDLGVAVLNCAPASPEKPATHSCESLSRADDPKVEALLGLLGVSAPADSDVGLTCAPPGIPG